MMIEVTFLAGTDIIQALAEAKEKARLWKVAYVTFNFNETCFFIGPTADLKTARKEFSEGVTLIVYP